MNMWASTKAFTRGDLRKAFDEYAEAHGVELAASALQRSTGAREVSAVPEGRILNGMVELVGGYSFVGKGSASQSAAHGLAAIHARLNAIREDTFRRSSKVV